MEATELRHIVLFGFRAGTRDGEIAGCLGALAEGIPGIDAFEWGLNDGPEGKTGGHSHCRMPTFVSEAARDAYLPHPRHREFVAFASEWIELAVVFDDRARSAGS